MATLSDPAAERGIISGTFTWGRDAYIDVADLVNEQSFTVDLNQIIWTVISHTFETKNIDKLDFHTFLSCANELKLNTHLDSEPQYLSRLIELHVEKNSVREHAKKVKKLQLARDIKAQCKLASSDLDKITGNESVTEILGLAENRLFEYSNRLSNNSDEGIVRLGDNVDQYVQFLIDNPNRRVGISTGYPFLDGGFGGGLRRKSFYVIAARTGVGKSLLCDNIATRIAKKLKIPVLMLDNEMDEEKHMNRMLAMLSQVEIGDIEGSRFASKEGLKEKIKKSAAIIKSIPYYYKNISGMDFSEVLSWARRWVLKEVGYDKKTGRIRDCVIFYDQLKLMNSEELKNGSMAETQLLGFQTMSLTNFCIKYDLPCLAVMQLNRDGITANNSLGLSQSDRIEWLASAVAIYKKKTPEEISEEGAAHGNRKMYIIKSRDGTSIDEDNYINFNSKGEIGIIEQINLRSDVIRMRKQQDGNANAN